MFVVYGLIDPRDGSMFYVGRSTSTRVNLGAHVGYVHPRRSDNLAKDARLKAIEAAGRQVVTKIIGTFSDCAEADICKGEVIANSIGLTNVIVPGVHRPDHSSLGWVNGFLSAGA
jgi:hypothetical protein